MPSISKKDIPCDNEERREWIKYQLKIRGFSLAELARHYSASRFTAIAVLDRPYPIWEARIAKILGTEPKLLWPDRYNKNGTPNRRRGRPVKSAHKKTNVSTRQANKAATNSPSISSDVSHMSKAS